MAPHVTIESRSLGHAGVVSYAASSAPIVDRGSLFTAQVCWPCKSVAAATAAIALMRSEGAASGADHNMSAYRVAVGKKTEKAYDDDGEAHGGQRLLGRLTKVKGTNVAVMVSRVWGGQMLGKARFEHICRAAEALLDALGHEPGVGIAHQWGAGMRLGGEAAASSSSSSSSQPEQPAVPDARGGPSSGGKKRKRSAADAAAEAAAAAAERRRVMAEAAERRASA